MKGNVLTRGLTRGATYEASVRDYYDNLLKQYEKAKRLQEEYERKKRLYEQQLKESAEKKAKAERARKEYLDKLKKDTLPEEREKAAVRAQEQWGNGETPSKLDQDLFEISDYKKSLPKHDDQEWYEKAWRKIKDFFLSSDGITATGWKMNDIQASQFSGNIEKSKEDQQLLNMAEAYYKGNKTPQNAEAIRELNKRKPGFLNTAAVYANKVLDWIGNNIITGTTGAFLGTDELDKVRKDINFDENTTSELALQNIAALRNSYKSFDEESYAAYLENHNKAKYYENLLDGEYKRKLNIAEGRIPDENGVADGSVDFFNFSKLSYQLPGIIAGSISSPSQFVGSFATGAATAAAIASTATAAGAAIVGTGGWGALALPATLSAIGAGATFGLNQASGAHENAAEVDEGYISKVKYELNQHPNAAIDFYEKGRSVLGKHATEEEIIIAKLANKIPSSNKIVDKAFDDAAVGSQLLYDRDMVATTGDSTIDTALQITPIKFFSTLGKSAIKANLRSSRIARAADKVVDKLGKLNGGDNGVLRKAFGEYGSLVSGKMAAAGAVTGTVLDNTIGRIPKVNTAIKSMAQFDIGKIRKIGPKTSNWLSLGGTILQRGIKSSISEGVEEGKQYYNQQRGLQEFINGLKNGNLSYETQSILGDVLDDFQAGDVAAAGVVQAITGKPMLDYLHYTDENIIDVAEAIKNIKSGMIGGHGLTTAMTAMTGGIQAIGTHGDIDDMELAIKAMEENKLRAQKQFAVDQILSRTKGKYIASAIDYLKNSNSIKLSEQELEDLQHRATEVKGVSDSPEMKAVAKELGISKDDYHKFVADYMYHKDNLETERENRLGAITDLNNKANEIKAESQRVVNPSDKIAEQWSTNDLLNDKSVFEQRKTAQTQTLEKHIETLKNKLEKEALTKSEKAEIEQQIETAEKTLEKTKESKFDESKKKSYAEARFDRINTIARILGVTKQLDFLNTMLAAMPESNVSGRDFIQKQITDTKKLLNNILDGNKLRGKQLTADNLDDIREFTNAIATQIERGDQDNEHLMGASAELTSQINSLAQAYQERAKATLNYNIAAQLFNDFLGYDTKDGEVVPYGTEGAKHVKGNAKRHIEGIISAQDDDASLEQAFQQGFADYGFSGVYKNESPLVQEEESREEEEHPGTAERRNRIKELGRRIRNFASETKDYISGKWENFGHKKVFVPDEPAERTTPDPSEDRLDRKELYSALVADYKEADDLDLWLDKREYDEDVDGMVSNAQKLIDAALANKNLPDGLAYVYNEDGLSVDVSYKGINIGTIHAAVVLNKADGDVYNSVAIVATGFDFNRIEDASYLESLIKPENPTEEVSLEEPETPVEEPAVEPANITEQQETKIQVLKDLSEKMNNKFDVSLRTSSHYFEWVGAGENRRLKLWHRLHDEIGSHFKEERQNKKNWSNQIKELYSVVYHNGYSQTSPDGNKDIQALLNRLRNFYETEQMNEQLLDRIAGYVIYLEQEGNDISDADLYECIKGIAEEIAPEVKSNRANNILDRGTAIDLMCRTIFGTDFSSREAAIEYCKSLQMDDKNGNKVFAKDYFTEDAFEQAISHMLDVKRVYVEELGYTLWTAPFTIYTEDFEGENGKIRIAGEVDMLAIDKDGNVIIIDYKTSKNPFFVDGKESPGFNSQADNQNKSPKEQYTNQQSAYVLMINETSRKETNIADGFKCSEARLLPIRLKSNLSGKLVEKVTIEFSKDQQLVLDVIPFEDLGNNVIFRTEDYRSKLAQLSAMYAKVDYIATHLNVYYRNDGETELAKQVRNIKESLDSILLCLQEVTAQDLASYWQTIENAIVFMEQSYFTNKESIDKICNKYNAGELELAEEDKAHCYNNLDWNDPLNDNDVDKLGGFEGMGVKDREEYDKKVEELAHVACERDFQKYATAKLTAVPYQTRRGNDKIAVYASITYNGVTYPPIRIYLAKTNGEQFAKDVLAGNTVTANVNTTVGLLSKCSDGKQHNIGDNKQLVDAIGGTLENPYKNFMVDADNTENVAIVTFNENTGSLNTVSSLPENETRIALPKNLRNKSANGHIIINVVPEVSGSGNPIPIVCNTKQIDEHTGKDAANHRQQSLLDFLVEVVLTGINNVEHSQPLKERIKIDDEEIPLTYGQILNFFFEPYDPSKGSRIQRPQYVIVPMPGGSRGIKIGNFARNAKDPARTISLEDTKAVKDAISKLNIWVSIEMASVQWSSSKPGSAQFNEFAKFLRGLEDGLKFYLGNTGIYFDKTDADGTFLGFLAKNGLLTTPFNGFSHPLISIKTSKKDSDTTPPVVRNDEPIESNENNGPETPSGTTTSSEEDDYYAEYDDLYSESEDESFMPTVGEIDPLDRYAEEVERARREDSRNPDEIVYNKIQKGRSRLDETAAREYVERVLGKTFTDNNLEFVDEICSAIVGGLSVGTIIAGQVTANMMKLSRYALNGTEYHESFHWAFELIMDQRDANKIRKIVRKKYGLTDQREIAEWLADAYMYYVRDIYVPKGTLIQKAFAKIRSWITTFKSIFTGEYLMYKLFNDLNSGKFANRPINNEAVLRFLRKFKELNQTIPTNGFEKDGIQYEYQQGPVDHEQNIRQIAFFALNRATVSPAASYVSNGTITVNVKDIVSRNFVKQAMMYDHYYKGKLIKARSTEDLIKDRQNPKLRTRWHMIDNALALRELLDDDHIDKTQEYVSAYIDRLIGVKGKDLSVHGDDDGDAEGAMDGSYARVEDGDVSFAGSPKEHIVPDHQISRMSKTSSRIKLFFATIPNYSPNEFGKFGYYNLRDIYQAVQNRYHYVLSPEELWRAIENDSTSNRMIKSLWEQISEVRKLVNGENKAYRENAIGLLNEIYKSIKSTKLSHEVTKTRRDTQSNWVTYRSVNIMVQNNSYAISREFTETVLGGFNKFYNPVQIKDGDKEIRGIVANNKIRDEITDRLLTAQYRVDAYEEFFGSDYKTFTDDTGGIKTKRIVWPIYNVLVSYGTENQKPLYIRLGEKYVEISIEKNLPYIKFKFLEALSSLGIDITQEQLDDILETLFGGTGVLQMKQFFRQGFVLPAKGNSHKAGAKVTIRDAMEDVYTKIQSELSQGNGVIRSNRLTVNHGRAEVVDGTAVFRNLKLHTILSILIATAQHEKYEVSARGVDGKLTYAMSDDNTVTAMCDVIFNKTNDPQCTKIRQIIVNDPFNMSVGEGPFRGMPVGSYILPRINGEDVGYEIVNDAGIETGNNENSSTNSDKRGADTIMSVITRMCLNMIVLAPFADKSTALSVRLRGIKIPGINYDAIVYQFKENDAEETLSDEFKSYIMSTTVDDTKRVILSNKDRELDETIAQYVLAEYYQAKKAIQDYKDIVRNHSTEDKNGVTEEYQTAFNICKKLMFMSQFSGDYVQNEAGEWTFKPFEVENGSNKTDIQAAEEMLAQFEAIVNDRESLLQFVNRHVNGMMYHELERLRSFGIVKKKDPNEWDSNPRWKNILLDKNILQYIYSAINKRNWALNKEEDSKVVNEQAILIFMYDIVGKSIISKQESERLFTGQSDLYNIKRDKETRIITVPYQDQAKRIGSFASTGSVGVIENEDYVCAEIPDDMEPIEDQVRRSIYMNEINYGIKTGTIDMSQHSGVDLRTATTEELMQLIPNGYRPIVDKKVNDALQGFVLEKDGKPNLNNVTDGVSFISAEFARRLLKSQGAWNYKIARAFKILTSENKLDIENILNSWETFSQVFTLVIGTQKYTAVGFRTELVNGQQKVIPYVNKTALFPVFACMCNEKMDAIRRQMKALNVDMLMFESAVKVGAHGNSTFTVDNVGNTTGHFNTYSQKSFFLRKQLNTDPNEKEKMKIGIQTVKVALSAAIGVKELDWNGEKVDGDVIIDQIMDDIRKLAEKRSEKLMSKLSTQEDVVDYVTRFLRGNNVPEQIIDAFQRGIPAEALSIQKHIDTLSAKRIQEDVVRIDSPGSAFIQRCVYGVEGPNVKFGSLELNDGEELQVINEDGSMDCVLSIDYFIDYKNGVPYFKLTPGKKKKLTIKDPNTGKERPMSFEEIRAWLKKNNVIGKNAKASILSYRIPTQAVASINALKCVDVIPVVRDTIVLPKLFTTITGADFDIDKLFISTVWYGMELQADDSFKPYQIEDQDSEEGLANTVVNDYINVLCATAKKRPDVFYKSIDEDTKLADDVIAFIKKLYPPTELDKLDNASGILQAMPSMQAKVHDEFLAGKQGIGPFALALVNHVLTRIYKVGFNSKGIYLDHKKLSRDIDDDGKSIMSWLSAMINKHVDVAKNPDITYLNVNDSTFNVVALLLRLGYGRRTFMFTCQEIMRDYAFTINQESAVCKYTKNENGYFDARQQAFNEIVDKYKLKNTKDQLSKFSQGDIYKAACQEIFDKNVSSNKSLCEYVLENHGEVPSGVKIKIGKEELPLTKELFQYLNLLLFNYLSDEMAKPLTQLQQASVIDNERCITSMIQSSFYEQAVQKVRDSKVLYNVDKLLDESYISTKISKTIEGTNAIYDGCSCMDKDVVTAVAKEIDPNILSYGKDRMNTFLSTIRDGMVAYYGAKFFDQYCKDNNIDRQQLFKTGPKGIVRRLASIQASARSNRGRFKALRNNLLILGLSIESIIGEQYEPDPNEVFYNNNRFLNYEFLRFKYAGQSDDNILADVQQAWDQLLNYPDKEIQEFARDLIVYSFYTSGEMPGMTKLFKYVPPSWRVQEGGYGEFFQGIKNNKAAQADDIDDIIDKLCRNLWYRDKFVRKVGKYMLAKFEGSEALKSHTRVISLGTGEIGESEVRTEADPIFSPVIAGIHYTDETHAQAIFLGGKDACPRYIKCVDDHHDKLTNLDDSSSTWTLYKLVGFNTYIDENQKAWPYPVYVLTSVLGEKYYRNNIFEFNEELEPNNNLDAYGIMLEFISKLGAHSQTKEDVDNAVQQIVAMLGIVNQGVNNAFEGQEVEIATETIDILTNSDNVFGKSTFEPLRTVNKSVDENAKTLEEQQKKICNR